MAIKLTVVSGPTRGASYTLQDGENSIGRQAGNTITLPSSKVSKRHCVLVVDNSGVQLRDEGSSNGTFVNGVLSKAKKVKGGDRISVGEFVLEVVEPKKPAPAARQQPAVAQAFQNNVVQFPGGAGAMGGMPGAAGGVSFGAAAAAPAGQHAAVMPKDIKGKVLWIFEERVMPVFYGMLLKNEWRFLAIAFFAVFVVGSLVISINPILQASRATIVKESGRRADFMAKEIVERNAAALAAHAETKASIGSIDKEDGVLQAVLIDMDSRILAPAAKLNQYLTSGVEAQFAVRARDLFRRGRESGLTEELDDSTLAAIEPVKVLDPRLGKNVVVGMALVSLDTSLATPDIGDICMMYSESLILIGLLAGAVMLILYKVTLKPFQVLNDDMDKALKGEITQVTHEFKMEELNSLWEIINSALQRVPKGSSGGAGGDAGGGSVDDYLGPIKSLAGGGKNGLVVFDGSRKIAFMNQAFEDASGIRSDQAIGQEIGSVARDQAMGAMVNDLLDRSPAGGEGVAEDFEMSGVSFKLHAAAFGVGSAKAYALVVSKNEG